MKKRLSALLAVAAVLLTGIGASRAASLEVGPIRVQMYGAERTTTVTLRNSGTAPMSVQVRAVDWTQDSNGDAYAPSATLVASPPLAQIAPGESQVVRLVIENVAEIATERTYRLILDEIPGERAGGVGVQTALRALVPVFITPSANSRPRLRWTAVRSGNNVNLTVQNSGDSRERLVNARVTAGGTDLGSRPEGYVLSGASRTWVLPAPAGAASVRVTGEGEYGAVEVDVPIGS